MGWGTFIAGQVVGNARRAGNKKRLYPSDIINPDYLLYRQTSEDKNLMLYCMFGGWFGAHRFKTRKYISGILFAFTFGGYGIGWVIDSFRIASGKFEFEDGLTGREKNPSNLKPLID